MIGEPAAVDATGPAERPVLRIGLVVEGLLGPAWIDDVVRAIRASPDAELVSVRVAGPSGPTRPGPVGRLLLRIYDRIDRLVFGGRRDPGDPVDLAEALADLPRVGHGVAAGSGVDLVLSLGSPAVTPEAPLPRFGAWAIAHGHGLPAGSQPERLGLVAGGPEMLRGCLHTISRLVATTGEGDRRVMAQVVSGVDRLSLRRGGRSHLAKLPGLVTRTLYAVRMDGALPELADDPLPTTTGRADLGTMAIAFGLVRIVTGFIARWVDRTLAPGRWLVAVSRASPPGGADPLPQPVTFAILEAPPGIEWADPFPVTSPGRELVFLEEYLTDRHRGRLAVVELDDSPRGWRTATTILDLPTHLSYPFVFQWEGAWYLLPEQAATGSLELYRAVDFPGQWAWHSTALAGVPAADATLAEIDGRWWLFAAIAGTPGAAADELHLYHSTTPLGPWTAHPRNPVVSDIRTARPAGRPYRHDGQWYRPAQDGSVGYGHSIAVVRIDRLDPDGYREHVAGVIEPTWLSGLIGTHTLNTDGQLTAIDGNRRKPRLGRARG